MVTSMILRVPPRTQLGGLAAVGLLLLQLGCGGSERNAPPVSLADPLQLSKCELPQDSVRYHFVVDRSGSMLPNWRVVQQQLGMIVDSLPERGYFQIDAFAGQMLTPSPIHNRQVMVETRASLRDRAVAVQKPDQGGRTDIGIALETAAEEISSARARGLGRVNFVFVLTDGIHFPEPDSKYGKCDVTANSWKALAQRWRELPERLGTQLIVYAVAVGADGIAGARCVRDVIPYAAPIAINDVDELAGALRPSLARAQNDLLYARAYPEVRDPSGQLSPMISASLAHSPARIGFLRPEPVPVVLHSNASCVTYRVRLSGVDGDSQQVQIPPGGSAQVQLRVRRFQPDAKHLIRWNGAGRTLTAGDSTSPLLRSATVDFEPVTDLTARSIWAPDTVWTVPVAGSVAYPPIGRTVILSGLGMLFLVVGAIWWRRLPPDPGHFGPTQKHSSQEEVRLRPNGKRPYVIHLDAGSGRGKLEVYIDRISKWSSPKRTRASVKASGQIDAAIAREEPDDGTLRIIPLVSEVPTELLEHDFILWRPENGGEWKKVRSQAVDFTYVGYQWLPAKPQGSSRS